MLHEHVYCHYTISPQQPPVKSVTYNTSTLCTRTRGSMAYPSPLHGFFVDDMYVTVTYLNVISIPTTSGNKKAICPRKYF